MSYIATVNWETLISSITLDAVTHYYHINVPAKNYNDAGAGIVAIGYYIVDYLGYIYEITAINVDGDSERVTVYDINEGDQYASAAFKAPYDGQIAFVYKANDAGTLGLSQSQLRRLSHSARDSVNQIDNNIIWGQLTTYSPTYGLENEIPHVNAAGDDLEYDSNFTWDGTKCNVAGNINISSGSVFKINTTSVLSATALGSTVVSSSLTSVGTIGTGVWNGTPIEGSAIASTSEAGGSKFLREDGDGTCSWQNATSVSFGLSNQIPHMNTGGTDFDYDSNLTWNAYTLNCRSGRGTSNVFIGFESTLSAASATTNNTIVGASIYTALEGSYNSFFGNGAGLLISSGASNAAMGQNALGQLTTGSYNLAIGQQSLYNLLTTSYNVAIGQNTGYNCTGTSNVFIGANAGFRQTTGSNKLFIDSESFASSALEQTGSLLYGDFAANELTINGELKINGNITSTEAIGDEVATANYITKTLKYTISYNGGSADYKFDADGDANEQSIQLGGTGNDILPAYAVITESSLVYCTENWTAGASNQTNMRIALGWGTGEDDITNGTITWVANLDTSAFITSGYDDISPSSSDRSIWFSCHPVSDWWSAMTGGEFTVYITYLDYGSIT